MWSMSGSEQLAALDAAQSTIAALQTYSLQLIAELERSGYAQELGARDTARLLTFRYRLDPREARRDLRLATTLAKYPAVSAALPDPLNDDQPALLHPAQAQAIVSALEKVPDTVSAEDLAVAEEQMVKAAQHLSPADLRRLGKKVRDTLDADGPEPLEDQAARREKLWLKNADHGVEFGGYLANANAELLHTLIDAAAKPHKTVDGERDPRSRDKRQADALVVLLQLAAGSNGVPGRPQVVVTIDYNDLRGATTHATGELIYGDGLSAAAVRRMACDAGILPIVLGSDSQPLDVGREERFVTSAIRRALIKRDGGCVVCKAPPSHCHAHHIVPWFEGGPTSLDNLVLVCSLDHTDIHAGHRTIHIINGTVHVSRPSWATPGPPTRLNLSPTHPSSPTPLHLPALRPASSDPTWITPAEAATLNPWGNHHLTPTRPHRQHPRTTNPLVPWTTDLRPPPNTPKQQLASPGP
ncbi:HNH endonuclease signature motif containing protein [Kribbella sancticallisti]|uniref:HNH endonuclease signature motif containing protein n=1 Tax=Kribbella sancticallisti TaxID=460087 RepID=A0ABP4P5Z4_9ACTN